jgi:HPt (histidine-containing phosphotransfer) domain-containing protein
MAHMNIEVLNQLADDIHPRDLHPVLEMFETDMQRLSSAMLAAAAAGDIASFRHSAHAIAGAASAVGAAAVEQAARKAMTGADPDSANALAEAVVMGDLVHDAVVFLRAFLAAKTAAS